MSGIAQKFLDFAKPSGGEFSAVNVKMVVRNVLNMVKHRATQQNVRVREEFPRESVLVSADQNQLEQVFLNLFLNALDAMPVGGRLSVKAEQSENHARIAVSDTGGGVPENVKAELFKPFNTSKPSGTGLGLSTVKRIVLDHQGDIRHENAAEGARFILSLSAAERERRMNKPKILVIDDEEDIHFALNRSLGCDYDLLKALDAETGLEIAAAATPDLVITDIQLPGISGIEALNTFKSEYPNLSVIVMTAHSTTSRTD